MWKCWVRGRGLLYQLDKRPCGVHLLCRQQQKPLETEVLKKARQQGLVYLFSLLMTHVWTVNTFLRGGHSDGEDVLLRSVTGLYQSRETEAGMLEGGVVACVAVNYCLFLLSLSLTAPSSFALPSECVVSSGAIWNVLQVSYWKWIGMIVLAARALHRGAGNRERKNWILWRWSSLSRMAWMHAGA